MTEKNEPAMPVVEEHDRDGYEVSPGLTAAEQFAKDLCVPIPGIPQWQIDAIRARNRYDFAKAALTGYLANEDVNLQYERAAACAAEVAYGIADAMLAESDMGQIDG